MTVSDGALKALGPFTAGVNNVAPETRPPVDQDGQVTSLREAVNVDLDAAGRVMRRRGTDTIVSEASHSLLATDAHLFAIVAGDLKAYVDDGVLTEAANLATLGDRFASMTSDDVDVYGSNGVTTWRVDGSLNFLPLWVDTPDPVSVSVNAAGGLASGQYEVSVTVVDASGRESGASNPVVVTLAAGQGIDVTLPAPPVSAIQWNVYASTPDGEVLYLVAALPIATTSYTITAHTPGRPLETAWLFPLLPCNVLRYGHNRLVGLTGDAMIWSEPYRLGLMHDQNNIGIARGTMLEAVGEGGDGAGWYVSDCKRVYFVTALGEYQGEDRSRSVTQQIIRRGSPAVPGTSMTLPGSVFGLDTSSPVAFWYGADGVPCIGLPGGIVKPIREGELAMPVDGERGATGFFEHNGIRQLLMSVLGASTNPLNVGMGDLAEATIRRNGVTI